MSSKKTVKSDEKKKKHHKTKVDSKKKNRQNKSKKKKQTSKKYRTKNNKSKSSVEKVPKDNKQKIISIIWNTIFYGLMLALLLGTGFMAIMQQQGKSFNGYRMFGVLTNSMVSPDNKVKDGGFRAGSIIVTKEVKPEEIKVGDIITYKPSTNPASKSTNYLTHRVAKIKNELGGEKGIFFVTKGDANESEDMPISSQALIGKKVFSIPKVGGILSFVKENWLVSMIFIVSVLGFIWIVKNYIFSYKEK